MKRKLILGLWLVLCIFLMAVTVLWVAVIKCYYDYHNIPVDYLIGNKPACVTALKETGFPFSFLVVGDTRTIATSEALMQMAVESGNHRFMIIVGDFVHRPTLGNHNFFLTEMATELKLPIPVFLVAGNHDISYSTSKKKSKDPPMTPEMYDASYGPRNFDFVYNNCLFIIVEVDRRNPEAYITYLNDTLSEKGMNKNHIFVFTHTPPDVLVDYIRTSFAYQDEFLALLEKYKVNTCFFGDYHSYWKGIRNGVTYIVSGGGGSRLRPKGFHHILKITVYKDKIFEGIIGTSAKSNLGHWFEEMIFTKILPPIKDSVWTIYLVLVILILCVGYALIKLIKCLNKQKTENHADITVNDKY
ncbi:MAG: metallophosphoesterase [Planctomycetota bacterium]